MLSSGSGRYAPSPSGDLHLGNLRTAVLAWAIARADGRGFALRLEDLDRVKEGAAERQLEDSHAVLEHVVGRDPPPVEKQQRRQE